MHTIGGSVLSGHTGGVFFLQERRAETVLSDSGISNLAFEHIDEQELFLSILYHDARGGNAIRMLLGPEVPEGQKRYVRHFANKDIRRLGYGSMKNNAYASLNTFRSYRRLSDQVFNHSGIFIDLDGHNYTGSDLVRSKIKTLDVLQKAFDDGTLSTPTMITDTGRGYGLFFILRQSIANSPKSEKSIKYLNDVTSKLTAKIKGILDAEKGLLEVDTTVHDAARVVRMPMTYNLKSQSWCRLIYWNEEDGDTKYFDLKELSEQNHLFDYINEVKEKYKAQKVVSIDAYRLPFLTIRMQKLELLQELRGYSCAGSREYMTFIYYNAAKQVYGAEQGVRAVKVFNERFNSPLDDSELQHAIDVTDKNVAPLKNYEGYYKLPDDWIMEKLAVTAEENAQCRFGSSKRQIEREQTKAEHKKAREERSRQIIEYVQAHPEMKYEDIEVSLGISDSMLRRTLKKAGISRYKTTNTGVELQVLSSKSDQNVQNLAESLLGVPSALGAGEEEQAVSAVLPVAVEASAKRTVDARMSLLKAYTELYDEVTQTKRQNKQIPGQLSFRWGAGGEVEYYMIS